MLIQPFCAGDDIDDIKEVIERYTKMVYGIALTHVKNQVDADDVCLMNDSRMSDITTRNVNGLIRADNPNNYFCDKCKSEIVAMLCTRGY